MTASLSEQILDVGSGQYFLSANTTGDRWLIQCPNQRPRETQECSSCIITLGCRCSLKTKAAYISASLVNCNSKTQTTGIQRTYIPNLIWISQLKDYSGFSDALYNISSELKQDPIPNLPPLPLPSYEEIREFTDKNAMIKTSLDKIMAAAKAQEPVYVTKMQEVTTKTRHSRLSYALNILSLIWLSILTVAAYFGGRYLLYLMAITSKFEAIEAATLSNPSQNFTIPTIYRTFFWYLVTLVTMYIILHTAYIIWFWYINHQKHNKFFPLKGKDPILTYVYLRFCTPFRLVNIPLDELCVPLDYLQVHTNHHNTIGISYRQSPLLDELSLTWSGISLKHSEGTKIYLPPVVKIPKSIRNLLYKTLSDPDVKISLFMVSGPMQAEHRLQQRKSAQAHNSNSSSRDEIKETPKKAPSSLRYNERKRPYPEERIKSVKGQNQWQLPQEATLCMNRKGTIGKDAGKTYRFTNKERLNISMNDMDTGLIDNFCMSYKNSDRATEAEPDTDSLLALPPSPYSSRGSQMHSLSDID